MTGWISQTKLRDARDGRHYPIVRLSHRRLPHLYGIGEPLFVTFRLHDSLPPNREFPARVASGKAFVCMDRLLDTERHGPAYLRIAEVVQVVVAAIRGGACHDYV